MPPRMGRNQGFTARVRRLFWWASDLSQAIGRICQICDRGVFLQARRQLLPVAEVKEPVHRPSYAARSKSVGLVSADT